MDKASKDIALLYENDFMKGVDAMQSDLDYQAAVDKTVKDAFEMWLADPHHKQPRNVEFGIFKVSRDLWGSRARKYIFYQAGKNNVKPDDAIDKLATMNHE
jgi:hypothetical protein